MSEVGRVGEEEEETVVVDNTRRWRERKRGL